MPLQQRGAFLPERSVCSVAPAQDPSDDLYTGNGSHRIDLAGRPYDDEITVTQELLYAPKWDKPPLPADLRPYIADIRQAILAGEPDKADALLEKAQREAGYDKLMNMDARIVYPIESPRVHKAFTLRVRRPEAENTCNYLRWLVLETGLLRAHWENELGSFDTEAIAAFQGDYTLFRFSGPAGKLTLELDMLLPGAPGQFGSAALEGSESVLHHSEAELVLGWKYARGGKGYAAALRFLPEGGTLTMTEDGVRLSGGSSLTVLAKVRKIEQDFRFGCENALAAEFREVTATMEQIEVENRRILGEKMSRSRLTLGDPADTYLSGEELLENSRSRAELYPMLMDKLYDMGRFYQIIDTGTIPPMWGQHNINTNLQVCAGNNTGLFEEMDVYFRYYEAKFDDFRVNARRLFGARGLLASVHCDPDNGLFYHFSKTYPHYCWTGCLGWIYNEFWGYYLVTGDLDFLRDRVVPALKEIALFFEDYASLRDRDGQVIFVPSFSPEDPTPNPDFATVTGRDIHPSRINAVMDIAICREVLTNLMTACRTLGIEQENLPRWQAQLDSLPALLTDEGGALKEWAWPTVEENYNHRHVSHHYDLWPGRAVTVDREPEAARAILISNRMRGQQDDSAHGIIHRAFCAIRLKDREEAEQNLTQLICHGFVRGNLSTAHFPYRGQFPDLQGAMPALLLEMCVYSEPGMVELLPCLPNSFPHGRLEGVWLYTWAKLETLEWTPGSVRAVITSRKDQTIALRIRDSRTRCRLNGEPAELRDGAVPIALKTGETVEVRLETTR